MSAINIAIFAFIIVRFKRGKWLFVQQMLPDALGICSVI